MQSKCALIVVLVRAPKAIWNIGLVDRLCCSIAERLEILFLFLEGGDTREYNRQQQQQQTERTSSCSSDHLSRFTDLTLEICVPRFL